MHTFAMSSYLIGAAAAMADNAKSLYEATNEQFYREQEILYMQLSKSLYEIFEETGLSGRFDKREYNKGYKELNMFERYKKKN